MTLGIINMILALAALGWGYWNHRRVQEIKMRVENARRSHFRLADEAREKLGDLEAEVRSLRHHLRTVQGGEPLFGPDTTVAAALALDERAGDVLAAFHIGGCSGCAVHPEDTLAQAASANDKSVDAVLQALNRLPVEGDQVLAELTHRAPNVQLSL